MEDLPLGRMAALVPEIAVKDLPLGRTLMIMMMMRGLKLPDICLTGEEKPRKNLSEESCPDRGSNPGPLRDRRTCYHLLVP